MRCLALAPQCAHSMAVCARWSKSRTTVLAHVRAVSCPCRAIFFDTRLPRFTRTDDGAEGRSRDRTTVSTIPPARCSRPSLMRNPRVV